MTYVVVIGGKDDMQVFSDTGHAQAGAEKRVFGAAAPVIQGAVFDLARETAKDYDGGTWAFVMPDDGRCGFWYPLDKETFDVEVPSNYFVNSQMQARAFGAGCTLVAFNRLLWHIHELGLDTDTMSAMYYAMREWVFDLAEEGWLDGAAVAGFID